MPEDIIFAAAEFAATLLVNRKEDEQLSLHAKEAYLATEEGARIEKLIQLSQATDSPSSPSRPPLPNPHAPSPFGIDRSNS